MSDMKCCLYCGRDTKAKCGICARCLGTHGHAPQDAASAVAGPTDHTRYEFESHYDENALGPHTSDERWGYEFVEDEPLP